MDANVLANLTSTFGYIKKSISLVTSMIARWITLTGNPNAEEARGERCSPEEPLWPKLKEKGDLKRLGVAGLADLFVWDAN